MSNTGTDTPPSGNVPKKLIYDAQQQVQRARADLWAELSSAGQPSQDTVERLQWAVLVYYDALHDHRTHEAVEDLWNESGPWEDGLDALPRYVAAPSERRTTAAGPRKSEPEAQSAPTRVDPLTLWKISHDLQDIQNELGLGAPARDTTPEDELDLDDLQALLQKRGQSQVAERLPDRHTEAD